MQIACNGTPPDAAKARIATATQLAIARHPNTPHDVLRDMERCIQDRLKSGLPDETSAQTAAQIQLAIISHPATPPEAFDSLEQYLRDRLRAGLPDESSVWRITQTQLAIARLPTASPTALWELAHYVLDRLDEAVSDPTPPNAVYWSRRDVALALAGNPSVPRDALGELARRAKRWAALESPETPRARDLLREAPRIRQKALENPGIPLADQDPATLLRLARDASAPAAIMEALDLLDSRLQTVLKSASPDPAEIRWIISAHSVLARKPSAPAAALGRLERCFRDRVEEELHDSSSTRAYLSYARDALSAIARNPWTPRDDLIDLARRSRQWSQLKSSQGPRATEIAVYARQIWEELQRNPNLPLTECGPRRWLSTAQDRATSPELLKTLGECVAQFQQKATQEPPVEWSEEEDAASTQLAVASHPATPADVLKDLSHHLQARLNLLLLNPPVGYQTEKTSSEAILAIARHPSTPSDALSSLMQQTDKWAALRDSRNAWARTLSYRAASIRQAASENLAGRQTVSGDRK